MSNKRNNHLSRSSSPHENSQQQILAASLSWTSPLPPPQVLEQYKNIDPNFVHIVISQIESEANHRRKCELQIVENQTEQINIQRSLLENASFENRISIVGGFLLASSLIGSSFYLAVNGQQWPAIAPFAAAIAYIFYGRSQKNKK